MNICTNMIKRNKSATEKIKAICYFMGDMVNGLAKFIRDFATFNL